MKRVEEGGADEEAKEKEGGVESDSSEKCGSAIALVRRKN